MIKVKNFIFDVNDKNRVAKTGEYLVIEEKDRENALVASGNAEEVKDEEAKNIKKFITFPDINKKNKESIANEVEPEIKDEVIEVELEVKDEAIEVEADAKTEVAEEKPEVKKTTKTTKSKK